MDESNAPNLNLGSWLGRAQALTLVSNYCSAAHAKCLQEIRDTEAYKTLNLTWEEFCPAYIGLSRRQVDKIIGCLEEFGEAYFRLSEMVRVSPATYRELTSHIQDDAIEIDGEVIPVTPANGPRIRAAVKRLRAELLKSQRGEPGRFDALYASLHLNAVLDELIQASSRKLQEPDLSEVRD